MAFGLEWRIATRIARRSLQLRPYRLQKTVVGILIVLAVLILSGPASKRKESTDEIRTVRTHLKEISVEEDSPRKFGPRQILSLCRSGHLHTLFFVHTSPDRFHDRKELRSYLHRPPEVAVVFMLGSSDDSNIALRIAQEAELYEDMVVFESFIDSYRNLTLKFVNSIRWIHHKCGNKHSLQNIIKLDDDAWVNFPMLKSYLLYGIPRHPNRIHCLVWRRVRVARRFTSKWFVSKREYALPYYPPYCGGLAYIIPRSLLLPLIDASYNVPFFWIDDVYATGLLARQAHVGHTQISAYYAFQVNESAALTPDWEGTMINAFGTTDIMFAHMNTKGLRSLRDFLFQVIDETLLNYTAFNIF